MINSYFDLTDMGALTWHLQPSLHLPYMDHSARLLSLFLSWTAGAFAAPRNDCNPPRGGVS